jgi:hypothetical protein
MHQLREYGGDKLVACFDPHEGSTLSLEVAYSLARARVLMARGEAEGIDASAIREAIERATGAMGDVLRVKQQLTGAKTSIDRAPTSSRRSRPPCAAQLQQVELLLLPPARGGRREGSPPEGAPTADRSSEEATRRRPPRASFRGERLPRAATIAAGQRPRVVREPEPPFPAPSSCPSRPVARQASRTFTAEPVRRRRRCRSARERDQRERARDGDRERGEDLDRRRLAECDPRRHRDRRAERDERRDVGERAVGSSSTANEQKNEIRISIVSGVIDAWSSSWRGPAPRRTRTARSRTHTEHEPADRQRGGADDLAADVERARGRRARPARPSSSPPAGRGRAGRAR